MSSKVNQNQFDAVMKLVANRIKPLPADMRSYPDPTMDIVFISNKKLKKLSGEELTQTTRKAIGEHLIRLGHDIQINVTQIPKPSIARADWNKLVEVIHSVGYPDEAGDEVEKREFEAANIRAREYFETMKFDFKGIKSTFKKLIDEQQDKRQARELRKNIEWILVNTLIEIRDNFPEDVNENVDEYDISFREDFISLLKNLDRHIELEREATLNFVTKEGKSSESDANTVDMEAVMENDSLVDETEATFLSKIKHGQSKEPLKINYTVERDQNNKTVYRLKADLSSLSAPDKSNSLIFAPELITNVKVQPSEMVVFEMFIILMGKLQKTGKPFNGQIHVNAPHILTASIAKIAYNEYMQELYGDEAPKLPEIHGATKFNASQLSENEKAIKGKMLTILKHSLEIKAQENNTESLLPYRL